MAASSEIGGAGDAARREAHPLARLGALVDAELQRAAAGDAAEDPRELVVVLELEPIGQAVVFARDRASVRASPCPSKTFQLVRAEAAAEVAEELVQLRLRV